MKRLLNNSVFGFSILLVFSFKLTGQSWNWEWANSFTANGQQSWLVLDHIDFMNQSYSLINYDSVLILPDTAFHHPEYYPNVFANCVLYIQNERGQMVNALDLRALPGENIYYTYVGTDQELNIYLDCTFSNQMFLMDTLINHCNTPYPYAPDVVIIKLNPQMEIQWAKLIGGTYTDQSHAFELDPEGNSYILSEQTGSIAYPTTVSFFGQDTVYADHDFTSLSKLDAEGNLLWRKDFHGGLSVLRMRKGKDGLIHLWGSAHTDIVLDGDTLFKPNNPDEFYSDIYGMFDQDGEVAYFDFTDLPVFPYDMVIGESGSRYVTGVIWDTTVLAQDTIIPAQGEYISFIGNFNTGWEPLWYELIYEVGNQNHSLIFIETDGDNLLFALSTNDDLYIADTVVSIYPGYEAFIGEYGSDGELEYIMKTTSPYELRVNSFVLDNCRNPLIGGSFRGMTYMGEDTLFSDDYAIMDAYIAKILREIPETIDLGPDTWGCDSLLIAAPPGHQYYIWNGELTQKSNFTVSVSGSYTLACGSGGCWDYDTVNIYIQPGFSINLGADTSVRKPDTLVLEVLAGYDQYLWSDGSTSNKIVFLSEQFDPGIYDLWVKVTHAWCQATDSLRVEVKSEYDVGEHSTGEFAVYPNPFYDKLFIKVPGGTQRIEVTGITGNLVYSREMSAAQYDLVEMELGQLNHGIYLIRVYTAENVLIQKLVRH